MVTKRTRTGIWMCLFDLKRRVRYYEALAVRHQRRHSLTLLFLAGGAGAAKLQVDRKLNEECEVVTKKIMVDKYAH